MSDQLSLTERAALRYLVEHGPKRISLQEVDIHATKGGAQEALRSLAQKGLATPAGTLTHYDATAAGRLLDRALEALLGMHGPGSALESEESQNPPECEDCEEEHDEGACPENRLSFDDMRNALINACADIKIQGGRISCGFLQAIPLSYLVRALHARLYCYTKEPGIFCTPCNEGDGYAKHCAGCGKEF